MRHSPHAVTAQTRHGIALLEVLVAVAVFVTAAAALLTCADRASSSLSRQKQRALALDLAASALAVIDAGVLQPEAVSSAVRTRGGVPSIDLGEGVSDEDRDSPWTLTIESEPASTDGLVWLTATASRRNGESAALKQLIRLTPFGPDAIAARPVAANPALARGNP